MQTKVKLHIIYYPGTFGNCLKWMLDRFSSDSNFKGIVSPWDKDERVHGFEGDWVQGYQSLIPEYSGRFTACHQFDERLSRVSADTPLVVINYNPADQVFVERCNFYRSPDNRDIEKRHSFLHDEVVDKDFLQRTFGEGTNYSKSVAKELYKIRLHDAENHNLWKLMKSYMQDDNNYQFPIDALFDRDLLIKELLKISEKFNLSLDIEEPVIDAVVNKTNTIHTVVTRNRAKQVLNAIERRENMGCKDLDLFEQSFIEVILEKKHDSIIFPYGTAWFENTGQINEFLDTYPSYLKHMNPRLKWYNGIKNPFYLTGKIDE